MSYLRADPLVLTGLAAFRGRAVAYLYNPSNGQTTEITATTPQRNIELLGIDTAKGTARIRQDGTEQTLRLGQGMPLASMNPPGETNPPPPNRRNLARDPETQRRLDLEAFERAKKLNEIPPEVLRRAREKIKPPTAGSIDEDPERRHEDSH